MATVDVHTHLLPPELPRWREKFGYGGFIQLEMHDYAGALASFQSSQVAFEAKICCGTLREVFTKFGASASTETWLTSPKAL